jgi:beta-amylase
MVYDIDDFFFLNIIISVMLPLNTVNSTFDLNNPTQLYKNLQQLKAGGVDGFMVDVWWGVVEYNGPRKYNWKPYLQLADMAKQIGLTMQVVTSFHQCGTNHGDSCDIPLPPWVLQVGRSNSNIFYKDREGNIDTECLSLGVDHQPVFQGRSAVQIYADFFTDFARAFAPYFPHVVDEVQVGLGPAGEMRYPSYQLSHWQYCGIGEFQTYDSYMLQSLKDAANKVG